MSYCVASFSNSGGRTCLGCSFLLHFYLWKLVSFILVQCEYRDSDVTLHSYMQYESLDSSRCCKSVHFFNTVCQFT